MSLLYADGSVFTVGSTFPERRLEVRPLEPDPPTNDPSFDLAVIQFDDSGVFVDRTQLDGRFDIDLEWSPDQTATDKPSIFTAVQEQLGLKLESSRGPVDVIVIDHIERPSEN